MHRRIVAAMMVGMLGGGTTEAVEVRPLPAATTAKVDYAKDIEPILRQACFKCHGEKKQQSGIRLDQRGSALRGGDSGEPGIQPGDSEASHLIQLVAAKYPEDRMPPEDEGDPLTDEQIALLRGWIDQGAHWPGQAEDAGARIATDHWSFQPVKRPEPPAVNEPQWVRNPIDAFIVNRMAEKGLSPSPQADRATLVRRLYLVMHGLPPTPAQIEAFVKDAGPDAYERLVDELLASPRYGERWAQHWLDVVHFAETNGFETNTPRPNAWRYRDYVIEAFNGDKPYDQFLIEQLAGDAMGVDVATGFLVTGAYDEVKSPDINLTLMQRHDELADMVNLTGTALLGLTAGCARCHNHKFDPMLQKDFYSLEAVFAGVQHGQRAMRLPQDESRERQLAQARQRLEQVNARLGELEPVVSTRPVVFVDDEQVVGPESRERGVILWVKKTGHGTNPPGAERGYRDDAGGEHHVPNLSGGRYTYWDHDEQQAGKDLLAYQPAVEGRYRLWLSWGCGWHTHGRDVQYLLDDDGDAATTADQRVIATVDQQRFADGTGEPVSKPLFSGLRDGGVHELKPTSRVILRAGKTGSAITADVLVLEQVDGQTQRAEVAAAGPAVRPPVNARMNVERFAPVLAKYVRFTIHRTNQSEPCIDELEIWSQTSDAQSSRNVALATAGAKATSSGDYPGNPKHKLEHIHDGQYSNDRSWISNTDGRGWVQIELAEPTMIHRIVWQRDREQVFKDRLATSYVIEAAAEEGKWQVIAGAFDRAPDGLAGGNAAAYGLNNLPASQREEAAKLLAERAELTDRVAKLSTPTVMAYAGTFTQPKPTHRLYRGDPLAPREVVEPEALTVLIPTLGSLGLDVDAPEQQRRVMLAKWITDKRNPLTARVMVNRLWHYHFGTGIVDTPSDFGGNGSKPTHPQLLDWLADEFVASGWSIKHMHRLILRSSTYRQSSAPNPSAIKVDAGSRTLWRYPPRRLEAEAIRDSMLAVAGTLDLTIGGVGFDMFKPNENYVRVYEHKEQFGPAEWRRMVYQRRIRMETDGVFGAFDCPDAAQVTPKRSRSTTALQALNLMNSAFVMQQTELFAERIRREAGDDAEAQVRHAASVAFGRPIDEALVPDATALVKAHGLAAYCRVLFNSNAFLFLN